jgi:hypothetical protein
MLAWVTYQSCLSGILSQNFKGPAGNGRAFFSLVEPGYRMASARFDFVPAHPS